VNSPEAIVEKEEEGTHSNSMFHFHSVANLFLEQPYILLFFHSELFANTILLQHQAI
jgi:hypothetical protein